MQAIARWLVLSSASYPPGLPLTKNGEYQAPSTPGGLRQLAVNGRTDLFTLCPGNPGSVTILMYNFPGPSYEGYECYPVTLQIVQE
jgi:hypothetical protein